LQFQTLGRRDGDHGSLRQGMLAAIASKR
jgi:hypothetical protein